VVALVEGLSVEVLRQLRQIGGVEVHGDAVYCCDAVNSMRICSWSRWWNFVS